MFDETLRALKRYEEPQEIPVELKISPDADGYIDKECPNQECLFPFKVYEQDWIDKVRDEEVFCPFCGHTAAATSWYTTKEIEWVKQAALAKFVGEFDSAMESDARNFNRRQPRNSFVTMKLRFEKGHREVSLPLAASETMRLKIACPKCTCRYSVVGSAYFCPSCGHNAAEQVFNQSLDRIIAGLDAEQVVRAHLADRDAAENATRVLIENGLQQAVTAFQRFSEALWSRVANAPKARRNAFQNLQEGSTLWQSALGISYEKYLSGDELKDLARYFQQRHLLSHREGLVDEDYCSRSGDSTYRAGQRLVIRADAVRGCVALVRKLGHGLETDVGELAPT